MTFTITIPEWVFWVGDAILIAFCVCTILFGRKKKSAVGDVTIRCPACQATFSVKDDELFGGPIGLDEFLTARCPKCGHYFMVMAVVRRAGRGI
jgi:predicted Zn finger-like uncharacterized protein